MKRLLIAALLLCPAASGLAQDIPLSKILVEGHSWQQVAKDLPGITFLEGKPDGDVEIFQGKLTAILQSGDRLSINPGKLPERNSASVPLGFGAFQLDPVGKTISERLHQKEVLKLDGLAAPSCLVIWPDSAQLVIGDAGGKFLWTAPILKGGKLGAADRYYALRVNPGTQASGVSAMTMDAGNLLYACTNVGVQVFDPTGRLCGVLLAPSKEEMTAICIGGEKGSTLYVACGDKIYSRKIQGKAVYTLKKEK